MNMDRKVSMALVMLELGQSTASIARKLRMNETTIRKYRKVEKLRSQTERPPTDENFERRPPRLQPYWPVFCRLLPFSSDFSCSFSTCSGGLAACIEEFRYVLWCNHRRGRGVRMARWVSDWPNSAAMNSLFQPQFQVAWLGRGLVPFARAALGRWPACGTGPPRGRSGAESVQLSVVSGELSVGSGQ